MPKLEARYFFTWALSFIGEKMGSAASDMTEVLADVSGKSSESFLATECEGTIIQSAFFNDLAKKSEKARRVLTL